MTRILMVCLGNICRSPLAHGILQSKLSKANFYIDSAGTAAYHIGKTPDHRSIKVAKEHAIDISMQSARQFNVSDFDTFDYIYAMDESNYDDIVRLARSEKDASKVNLFLKNNTTVSDQNVPDPYYGDISDFQSVFDLINETCNKIAKMMKGQA